MAQILIAYSSRTGNTKKVAEALYSAADDKCVLMETEKVESLDGYEMPPRTQFSMIKKPAINIKYGHMTCNMAALRLFQGVVTAKCRSLHK